jgi:peroxiredoxin
MDADVETLSQEPELPGQFVELTVGQIVPDFTLGLVGGIKTSLSSLAKDSPVLLNFIKGTWCPFCQAHMRNLQKWRQSVKHSHVNVIVVTNETEQKVKAWLKENHSDIAFATVSDPKTFEKWGVDLAEHEFPRPATFLVSAGLKLEFAHYGNRARVLNQIP